MSYVDVAQLLFVGAMLLLSNCCPFLPPAAYEAAMEECLSRYSSQSDVDNDRDVACVDGVRELRKRLGQ